jgi:hypothetical protein
MSGFPFFFKTLISGLSHPYYAAGIVLVLLAAIFIVIGFVARAMKALIRGAQRKLLVKSLLNLHRNQGEHFAVAIHHPTPRLTPFL